ncbi:unnamed protein product [Adineta steineri]|uniref:G-protein coupled receptors family 1 profile domain-containing protein n=1 Tax=Adineta steineri TaxID=433720 RepID=A0A814Y7L4_9BILA|nr:unnamed protein product [Adineta steineri]
MINRSTVLCRIRGYIIHTSSMSFRYLLVLLCADRYALCNKRVFIRALSRPQIAYRSVAVTAVFWSVVSIHLLIWESIENGRLCRIRGYIIHTSSMSFRYLLVLLCADRYALCNKRVFIRALSRPQIAYRSVAVTTVFWSVVSIHLLIWESIENGRCGVYGIYGQIFSFYVVVFTGFIPIVSMISFGILLGKSLKSLHAQIQPLNSCHRLNRRDISLIKLVLVEIIVYIICTALYPPMTVYTQITSSMASSKTAERKQIETFINFIIMSFLLYLNYNTTFYVHLITSKSFRNQVKDLILKCCGRPPRNVRNHQSGLKTMSKIPGRQLLQRTTNV